MKRRFISIIAGGFAGYLYYYFVGCRSGACAITSNPMISTIYGALLISLVSELLHDVKKDLKNRKSLFDAIAPVYAMFYNRQRKHFEEVLIKNKRLLDIPETASILDVGCGTGALGSVFSRHGYKVTGAEPSEEMLRVAKMKAGQDGVTFVKADALETLPFGDKSFDLAIASYVAHGMKKEHRMRLYSEMSRVARNKVVIYDYNRKRSLLVTIIEWLEHGDYFYFIDNAEAEMRQAFGDVQITDVSVRGAWYICTPAPVSVQAAG